MGRELLIMHLKQYARRWAFKHPTPADFFRTMEDASGEDLDWFWRGWFYSTDAVDISLDSVKVGKVDANAVAAAGNSGSWGNRVRPNSGDSPLPFAQSELFRGYLKDQKQRR